MQGEIILRNNIDSSIGVKAFIINVKANNCEPTILDETMDIGLDEIMLTPVNAKRSKILIFEDQVFSQIALENILFDELKLKSKTMFMNSGNAIAKAI